MASGYFCPSPLKRLDRSVYYLVSDASGTSPKEKDGTNMNKLLVKSILIASMAFSAGIGSAHASQDPVDKTNQQIPSAAVSTEQEAATLATAKPALVPGDFFYFIKAIYESIRLAIASGEIEEAKLLSGYAHERLAEANALLAAGKEDAAAQTLQLSLETQQLALEKVSAKSETKKAAEAIQPATVNTVEKEDADSEAAAEAAAAVKAATKAEATEEAAEAVKANMKQNIVALTAALEKVGNPKAQLALLRNIEKSFEHMEKKLAKSEQKPAKEPAKAEETIGETVPEAAQVTSAVTAASITTSAAVVIETEQELKAKSLKVKENETDTDAEHPKQQMKQQPKEKNENHANGKEKAPGQLKEKENGNDRGKQ